MTVESTTGIVKKRGRPKGPEKPPKEKRPRGRPPGSGSGITTPKPNHAPFVTLVQSAVKELYTKKGVSKVAIVRHIMETEAECTDKTKVSKSVRTALKRLVQQKVLAAPKGTIGKFRLTDDKGTKSEEGVKKRGRPAGTVSKKVTEKLQGERRKKSPIKKVKLSSPKKEASSPKKTAEAKKGTGKRGRPKKDENAKSAAKRPPMKTTPPKTTGKGRGRPKGSTKQKK